MNTSDLINIRLTNQELINHRFTKPKEVVMWFGAMQSQDYPAAKWAISQRLNSSSNQEIEDSFNKGEILRTHLMRPTWHFVAPEDIKWIIKLTGERVKKTMNTYNKILGLNDEIFIKSEKIIERELKGNNYLTRNEIGSILKKNGINWQGNGLAHIVSTSELNGIICSGPKKDKQHTYALLSERSPFAIEKSRDESLKELAKRYFQSHGPAQIIDYVWWSGLLTGDAKRGIELNPNIQSGVVEGKKYYFYKTEVQKPTKRIYLLPNYDEYTVAFRDREILVKNIDKSKLDSRQNSLFNNVIIIDGRIEGMWRRTLKTRDVIIETRMFKVLNIQEKNELHSSFEEYAKFLGLKAVNI